MNSRIGVVTVLILLSCGVFANFAQAQSPSIVWQIPYTLDKNYLSVKFTADSSQLVAGGEDLYTGTSRVLIKRFNAETGMQFAATGLNYWFGANEIALSPDGQKIITANYLPCSPVNPPACVGGFLQYDAAQLNQLATPPNSNASNASVDYSPNGQLIALGGGWYNLGETDYYNLRLVRASDLTIVRTMEGHLRGPNNGGTLSVRFSPDGTLLGTSGRDKFVKIWRVSDGALLRAINFDDTYEVDSAAFSPDGQFIAAGRTGIEAQIKVWRVSTGELVKTFDVSSEYTFTQFNKVAWTPDGRYVVAGISFGVGYGDSRIKFWNFQGGQLAEEFSTQNTRFINDITFSPNGQKFAWAASSQVFVALNPFPGAPFAGFRTFSDFDGDRKSDISVFRSGTWYIQASTSGFRAAQFGLGTDKIVPADYDGDTKTDIAVVRNGIWYILNSATNSFRAVGWGFASDTPVPGDYDGDGKADVAVFRNGAWYILQSTNSQILAFQLGDANSKPVAADYDADAKTDPGVFQNGAWSLLRSRLGVANFIWGQAGDKPVPADYDGDGFSDPAVFGTSGVWRVLRSNGGITTLQFGFGTDTPVPADYDGDGKTDIAVFRNGVWYLNSTTNGFQAYQFGLASDIAVPSAFIQ